MAKASDRVVNYTTTIPARVTAGQCLDLLAAAGADTVSVRLGGGVPVGLSFRLMVAGPGGPEPRDFDLPVNVDGVLAMLTKSEAISNRHVSAAQRARWRSREHATDVAWRVLRDLLEAQVAMVAAQMATLDDVLLSSLLVAVPGGVVPLVEAYRAGGYPAIEAGGPT